MANSETPRLEEKSTLPKISFLLLLYFIQGLPFGFQEKFLPIYFRTKGYDYTGIFLFRLIHVPWLCKLLWAPFIDHIKNKRKCVAVTVFILFIFNVLASSMDSNDYIYIAALMLCINFFVSFQDVALDTLALTSLSTSELGHGNTAQIVGYKLGMTVGSGVFAYMTYQWGLHSVFLAMAAAQLWALGGFIWTSTFISPKLQHATLKDSPNPDSNSQTLLPSTTESRRRILSTVGTRCLPPEEKSSSDSSRSSPEMPVVEREFVTSNFNYYRLFRIRGTAWLIFFVVTYKLGETGVLNLFPLFLIDGDVPEDVVFWWSGIVAHLASILGSVIGGLITGSRRNLVRNLTSLVTIRFAFILILTLIVLNTTEPFPRTGYSNTLLLSGISLTLLSFFSGLITTVTFTLMMTATQQVPKSYQALYYSSLSTMEVFGKLAFMLCLGVIADQYGEDITFVTCLIVGLAQIPVFFLHPKNL